MRPYRHACVYQSLIITAVPPPEPLQKAGSKVNDATKTAKKKAHKSQTGGSNGKSSGKKEVHIKGFLTRELELETGCDV
jgi:hypothetical protein